MSNETEPRDKQDKATEAVAVAQRFRLRGPGLDAALKRAAMTEAERAEADRDTELRQRFGIGGNQGE